MRSPRTLMTVAVLTFLLTLGRVLSISAQEPAKSDELGELKKKLAAQEVLIQQLLEWKKRTDAAPSGVPEPHEHEVKLAKAGGTFPMLQFNGFGSVSYGATDRAGEKNSFALGQLDLFVTSQLAEDLDVLTELVVESHDNNEFEFEIERLQLNYRPSDAFNISAGRYHTAIGYYNTTYHHGAWLETATSRPRIFEFEDEHGVLPIHNIGLSANGNIPSGTLNLHYIVEVGNGRHYSSSGVGAVLNAVDDNNSKAINLALTVRPDGMKGFQAGVSGYLDWLSPEGQPKTDQFIFAAHAVWMRPKFEWLNEALWFRHQPEGGQTTQAFAAYSQIGQQWGDFRPYLRYQYYYAEKSDPIFSSFGDIGLIHGPSLGLRYNFSELAAIKFQYDHFWRGGQPAENRFTAQVAFTF